MHSHRISGIAAMAGFAAAVALAGAAVGSAEGATDPFYPPGFPVDGPTNNQSFGLFSSWDQVNTITSTGDTSGDLLGTFDLHFNEFQIPCGLGPCLVNYAETVSNSMGDAPADGTTYDQFSFLGSILANEFVTGPGGTGDIFSVYGAPIIDIPPVDMSW